MSGATADLSASSAGVLASWGQGCCCGPGWFVGGFARHVPVGARSAVGGGSRYSGLDDLDPCPCCFAVVAERREFHDFAGRAAVFGAGEQPELGAVGW